MSQVLYSILLLATLVGVTIFFWLGYSISRKYIFSKQALQRMTQRWQESENRFRSIFNSSAIGKALLSSDLEFIRVNECLCQMLGRSDEELLSLDLNQIVHSDDIKKSKEYIQNILNGKIKNCQFMQRFHHKNGDIIWVMMSLSLLNDIAVQPPCYIIQLQNVTTEKKAEEQLRYLAYHDALTGLANRNKLEQQMNETLALSRRHVAGFAVLFMDVDHFKNINDTIGHDAGDVLLQIIAGRLKKSVRNTDILARVGGDEFIIVLTDINNVHGVATIVQKMLSHLLEPIMIQGNELYITVSLGISLYPYDGGDIATLMKNSDLALYRAKELGRNNYQFCTPEMTAKAREKMTRQNALVQSLAKNEFELFYQPKMDLVNQRINGVEALLRWKNDEYAHVGAEEIIRLAEETGFILALNDWVLKTACQQAKTWHDAGYFPLTMSVNLSARQFKQANFANTILETLSESQLAPECLELEITEALIMQDPEYVLSVLNVLKEKKIRISIDDFGTGYSSLDYLRRFHIDKIKIDKSFIQRILVDSASASVVTAIIAMSNKLGIVTSAEGVETKEQYDFLLKEKCNEIQGYFLSRPMDGEAMTQFLENPESADFYNKIRGVKTS